MRKNLFPLLAALAICGAVTAGIVASTAHAQPGKPRPMMIALVSSTANLESAAPPVEGGPPPRMMPQPPQMPSPPQMSAPRDGARMGMLCQDMYARQVGELAYMGAKLDLTASQTGLFDRWKKVRLDIAKRRQGQCATRVTARDRNQAPSMIDQMAREQQQLKTRLADLDAERPALETLYNSLSAAQKRQFHERAGVGMAAMMGRGRLFAQAGPRPLDERGVPPMPVPHGAPPGPLPQ